MPMSPFAATDPENRLSATTCFSVHAWAEPGVMPRVLELFAKRGLVPCFCQSSTLGADRSQLAIDIQMRGLGRETMDYIAACLRQITCVQLVSAAQRHLPDRTEY
jgi:acetolactate synthase regulatory subunit